MDVPSKVIIAGRRYEISTDPADLAKASRLEQETLHGYCDRQAQRILVLNDSHDQNAAETLVHEILHAVTQIVGLADEWGEAVEEATINRLAPAITQTIAENPKLTQAIQRAWKK